MYDNLIAIGLQLIIAAISFCIGKFLLPRLPKDTAAAIQDKLDLVKTYAAQYVNYADRFMDGASGTEKLTAVVGNLKEIANRYGFQATDQDLTAIAQTAFEDMSLKWDELEGNINTKAQEMAANMCMAAGNANVASAVNVVTKAATGAVDQQTIDDANMALSSALEALENAKSTIAELKKIAESKGTEVVGSVQQIVETPKQLMQDKIAKLKEATASLISGETEPEPHYEEDPEYDESEPEAITQPDSMQTMVSKLNPDTVAEAMKRTQTPTPTSLKELAASQATKAVSRMTGSKADDLAQFLK